LYINPPESAETSYSTFIHHIILDKLGILG
jgi:hypothetical protein